MDNIQKILLKEKKKWKTDVLLHSVYSLIVRYFNQYSISIYLNTIHLSGNFRAQRDRE